MRESTHHRGCSDTEYYSVYGVRLRRQDHRPSAGSTSQLCELHPDSYYLDRRPFGGALPLLHRPKMSHQATTPGFKNLAKTKHTYEYRGPLVFDKTVRVGTKPSRKRPEDGPCRFSAIVVSSNSYRKLYGPTRAFGRIELEEHGYSKHSTVTIPRTLVVGMP